MCTIPIKQVKSKTFITFLMVWKTSSTARGMTPGMCPPPIMVKVFPEDVCPYANMVPADQTHMVNARSNARKLSTEFCFHYRPLYPSTEETTRGLAKSW